MLDRNDVIESKPLNRSLSAAKAAKQDEFYTQYVDIQKEVEAYLEFDPDTFRGKVVYCNCDDPFESNFFKYFAANFNKLGLKKLITTSYDGSPIAGQGTLFPEYNEGNGKRQKPKALAFIIEHVKDEDGDGAANVTDVELFLKHNKAARSALKGNPDKYPGGDFRSAECIAFLKEADIVVTNPPFSLFREYVTQLVEHGKKFLILGDQNAITYREIFQLIKENKLWLGVDNGGTKWFQVPDDYDIQTESRKKIANGVKYFSMGRIMWFTNLDHGRRHQVLPLMTMAENLKFSRNMKDKGRYDRYDNFDAIEVPTYKEIPSDYDGMMGVPITFLDKYNPDQFEIMGSFNAGTHGAELGATMTEIVTKGKTMNWNGPVISKTPLYKRIVIRHRRPAKGKKE
ncbi:Adenine-specific methyltransferase EcoRI [Dehalogenimonas formicexedens]|uniref:Adenine-specific methyltransferase EcoRI n=1 Tax=Dehalogenimonas formicexedens TaxID=1839801 RepID=A0A1P8F5X4_9CHLR|nr:adenine-specific methyltransferase EcoRI family protein [Dehalogenimonas formicexedens]APV43881.1 Adenine-specific methyltransferase EcoRI [Dehalogenimonas formicexedens]